MKSTSYFVYGALALSSALLFQNCSPGDFSSTQNAVARTSSTSSSSVGTSNIASNGNLPASPSTGSSNGSSSSGLGVTSNTGNSSSPIQVFASGNSLSTNKGKTLNFLNQQGLSIGTASITNTQSSFTVSLYNAPSGRKASVKVFVDTSGNFLRVTADSAQPYMCHDPNANICAQFPNATSGQMEGNCQSPIYFSGALNGSVNGLTSAASNACSSSAAGSTNSSSGSSSMCAISYSGGGSIQTPNQSQAACQAECQTNQSANPTETLTCRYNGQLLTSGATANVNVCAFSFSSGGSGWTANSSVSSCQAECRSNANANPTIKVACSFNNQTLPF